MSEWMLGLFCRPETLARLYRLVPPALLFVLDISATLFPVSAARESASQAVKGARSVPVRRKPPTAYQML